VQSSNTIRSGSESTFRERSSSARRSSFSLDTIRHAGGVNSLDNFARSWTRAATFFEVAGQQKHQYAYAEDEDAFATDDEDDLEAGPSSHLPSDTLFGRSYGSIATIRTARRDSFNVPNVDSAAAVALLNTHEGNMVPDELISSEVKDSETEPLLVRKVAVDDGKVVNLIVGQSTLPQTVFNSVNVLIGIGLLSLPLGLKYSGWVMGLIFLSFSAVITNYTAKLLAKCMDRPSDQPLVTYADIAYAAYGNKIRYVVSVLFSMELIGACVALVVLFADTLAELFPGTSKTELKIMCGIILLPLSFVPLRVLSLTSILGIASCFGIVSIMVLDGFTKPEAPGSLLQPMPTYWFPQDWWTLPMSFGLLMSPWGGHGVFPNIYKDMRHPAKYEKSVNITYGFTFTLDMITAIAGYLMFGDTVRDEITSNILNTPGYPAWLSSLITVFIAIIPLSKTPLNARPVVSTIEVSFGLDSKTAAGANRTPFFRIVSAVLVRVLTTALFVYVAIVFPDFDRIMALLGSFLCFTICVILPMTFYLKIFGDEVPTGERWMCYTLITISIILSGFGTVWSFI